MSRVATLRAASFFTPSPLEGEGWGEGEGEYPPRLVFGYEEGLRWVPASAEFVAYPNGE